MSERRFPDEFLWGASTAAHQVEGSQDNNWSRWEPIIAEQLAQTAEKRLHALPSWKRIKAEATRPDNYISGVAAGHYSRFRKDIEIMRSLHFNAYRFSIEWSRIEPESRQYNQEAIDHYKDKITQLRRNGIEPVVVLHHFTNPVWFDDRVGWHRKEAVELFSDYVSKVVQALGSDVRYWLTINEPNTYYFMRYLRGNIWPAWPKRGFQPFRALKAARNFSRAHKRARATIHACNDSALVSTAHGWVDIKATNWISRQLARIVDFFTNTLFVKGLENHMDFIGVNHYSQVAFNVSLNVWPREWVQLFGDHEITSDMGWSWDPGSMYNVLMRLKSKQLPIIITENGLADAEDSRRKQFLQIVLRAVHQAIQDGVDVRGYLHWSLLDNYEWSEGFWPKFGLIEVDRKTQQRRVRPSAKYYAGIARDNALPDS